MVVRGAVTVVAGQEVPDDEVSRGQPSAARSFQVREAKTVHVGPRRRGKRTAGGDACATDATLSFQVREAGSKTLRPPHWAGLKSGGESNVDSETQKPDSGQD